MTLLQTIFIIYFGVMIAANLPLVREGLTALCKQIDMATYVILPFWSLIILLGALALVFGILFLVAMLGGSLINLAYQSALYLSGRECDWRFIWEKD